MCAPWRPITTKARRSITLVNVVRNFAAFTLLDVTIKTGRTHQIRVHLQACGHPIVGDDKYGDFALNKALARGEPVPGCAPHTRFERMFLHARRLRFVHPASGEAIELEAVLPQNVSLLTVLASRMTMNDRRRFDLIVFDWDGTLFDSTALIVRCIQASCRDLGGRRARRPPSRLRDRARPGGCAALRGARPGARALPRARRPLPASLPVQPTRVDVVCRHRSPLLHALKNRNHWLAVATGKSRRGLDEALRSSQLDDLFDATRTADETASKPDPLMLLELMSEFGVAPERTLMIGDTTHDLQMAANAGTPCVAVSYGAHEPAAFALHSPIVVTHTTAELHDWLAQHA